MPTDEPGLWQGLGRPFSDPSIPCPIFQIQLVAGSVDPQLTGTWGILVNAGKNLRQPTEVFLLVALRMLVACVPANGASPVLGRQ